MQFHAIARKVTKRLRSEPGADDEGHDALLARLYAEGGAELLEKLLGEGRVDSAAALTTAFHAFCDRLLALRAGRSYRDIFVAEEYPLEDVVLDTTSGKLFVSGIVDCVRRRPDGNLEVVDYKLTTGQALDKELLQIALYRRLLMAVDPGLDPHGCLEYFLPALEVTSLEPAELDTAYATTVAPFLNELVAARKALSAPSLPAAGPAKRRVPLAEKAKATRASGAARSPRTSDAGNERAAATSNEGGVRMTELMLGIGQGYKKDPVRLDFGDLKRHTAILGGSGSGKTTLALNLVEQMLEGGIPVLLVDRKGDLARYADPGAWSLDNDGPERTSRRRRLRERLDIALYTPGHTGGRPLRLTLVPDVEGLDERDRQQLFRTGAQALGEMLSLKKNAADEAKRGVIKEAIEVLCETGGGATVSRVIELLESEDPAFLERLGVLGKQVDKLLMQLKSFSLMNQELLVEDGETLDAEVLLGLGDHAVPGKTRLCIVSTRFFDDDAAALFWVSQLLGELNRFAARRPSGRLQAVVLFDEADVYLPATRSPVTKAPMESLLKRARSAGLGLMLATQSPGDLDYKCRENVLSWLVGRVKEPRALEKLKPLAGAAGIDAAVAFPKQTVGQFHLLAESKARAFQGDRSLLDTEQLSERAILELARGG